MSYTTVTITDTVRFPDGIPVPYAVVAAYPKQGFANAGTTTKGSSAVADSGGAFTLALNATDDVGTAAVDPVESSATPSYHVLAFDPRTGEKIYEADVTLPRAATTPSLAQLNPII